MIHPPPLSSRASIIPPPSAENRSIDRSPEQEVILSRNSVNGLEQTRETIEQRAEDDGWGGIVMAPLSSYQ